MQDKRPIYRYLVYVCLCFPMVTQEFSYVKVSCAHLLPTEVHLLVSWKCYELFFFCFFLQMSFQGLHTFVITGCELIEFL